jgi:catechol 1,2-dioxygenase
MADPSAFTRRQFITSSVAAAVAVAGTGRAAECAPTEDNARGPFYIAGAPFRLQLAPDEEPGGRLRITGRVLGSPGCLPLVGAVVDVWHASAAGFYYNLEAPLRKEEFLLRGRVRTDAEGRYRFDTILPGRYPLTRTRFRPRHIHYTVSHEQHARLTTQLYFEGDPYLAGDPIAKPSLVIPLARHEGGNGPHFEGVFDIVLGGL